MNEQQMKMLSVKSAMERVIQGLITSYELSGTSKEFFSGVERLVASFFVSGQIDNNHLVRSTQRGDLEIRFSTGGQFTCLSILLPESLQWKVEIAQKKEESIRKAIAGDTRIDPSSGKTFIFNGNSWIAVLEEAVETEIQSKWPFPTDGKLESPGVSVVMTDVNETRQAYDGDVQADINDDERALRAYEKAKKAVERM